MSHLVIKPSISALARPARLPSLPRCSNLAAETTLGTRLSPVQRDIKLNRSATLGTHRSVQTRAIHAKMPRQLTAAERARVYAYLEAQRKAMDEITEYDPERVRAACEAVERAHPIDQALREAYSAELLKGMDDPLDQLDEALDCPLVKADAPWGLVVYRASYRDDASWDRMLAQISQDIEEDLEQRERNDLSARHRLVVMDDRSQFDGAGPDQVRKHFRRWAVDELRRNWREQPIPDEAAARLEAEDEEVYDSAGVRYNFCLLVDDVCLESLDHMSSPVVKLVNKGWVPYEQDPEGEEEGSGSDLGWEGGVTSGEFEDVGWMYVHVDEYVEIQNDLQEDTWGESYVRPPLMRFASDLETAPGFWRRAAESSQEKP